MTWQGVESDDMVIGPEVLAYRKAVLEFGAEDIERLNGLHEAAEKYAPEVIDAFYEHLLKFDETSRFFEDPDTLQRVKDLQNQYFLDLTRGSYDEEYVEGRVRIGRTHERIDLPIDSYASMYNYYLRAVGDQVFDINKKDPKLALETIKSLSKLIFLDMGIAMETYVSRREETIRIQQQEMSDLPTPVLRIRDRMLIVPIVGALDSRRALSLTEQLLHAVRDNRAKVVVIDVTGVPTIDSRVANALLQTSSSAKLMGATAVFTGISAEIATTLVSIGADLSDLNTVGDLQGGIEVAQEILNEALAHDAEQDEE